MLIKKALDMDLGRKFPREDMIYTDKDTGVRVRRVTGSVGNSNHLYFTNNGWYDGDKRLVFCSDRSGSMNLFSLDLENFEIIQLTDLPASQRANLLLEGVTDPIRNMCYFFSGYELKALDLSTFEMHVIYKMPENYKCHIVSCAYDSDYVYTSIYDGRFDNINNDLNKGNIKFSDIAALGLESRIVRIKSDGSNFEYIHKENYLIAHVNANPKNQYQLTYCHDGPWGKIDNRIFGMDTISGEIWKIHPNDGRDMVGHEYWYQDGIHIGYHGRKLDGSGERILGRVTFDNSEDVQTSFNYNTGHIFSFDHTLIVGDGLADGKYIRLWKHDGDKYLKPRALCGHFSSFKTQNDHPHPRFSPDGRQVLFSSDREWHTNIYIAEMADFEALPELDTLSAC